MSMHLESGSVGRYVLDAIVDLGGASRCSVIVQQMVLTGWSTRAKTPTIVVRETLSRLHFEDRVYRRRAKSRGILWGITLKGYQQ